MYLKPPCNCRNYTKLGTLTNPHWKRDCFHESCKVRRQFRSTGRFLLENQAGYVRVASFNEVAMTEGMK